MYIENENTIFNITTCKVQCTYSQPQQIKPEDNLISITTVRVTCLE